MTVFHFEPFDHESRHWEINSLDLPVNLFDASNRTDGSRWIESIAEGWGR
jgi:hypothetical protein